MADIGETPQFALIDFFSVEIEVALICAVTLHAIEMPPSVAFGMIYLWFEDFKTAEVLKKRK